ncbi:unnamed protein product [Choristocarpus tenellus]
MVQHRNAAGLSQALARGFGIKVWSVRVPILKALEAIVGKSYAPVHSGLDRRGGRGEGGIGAASVITGALLADVVRTAEEGAKDAKYSQVRAAAMSVVLTLTTRNELRLTLTPHKEGLVEVTRMGVEDAEPRVAALSSKVMQKLAWWP